MQKWDVGMDLLCGFYALSYLHTAIPGFWHFCPYIHLCLGKCSFMLKG